MAAQCYCGHDDDKHVMRQGMMICTVEVCDCDSFDEYDEDGQHAEDHDEEFLIDGVGFADPGGNSALRAATLDNPRNLPCPTCERPNKLTPLDVKAGYQCDSCSDKAERGVD